MQKVPSSFPKGPLSFSRIRASSILGQGGGKEGKDKHWGKCARARNVGVFLSRPPLCLQCPRPFCFSPAAASAHVRRAAPGPPSSVGRRVPRLGAPARGLHTPLTWGAPAQAAAPPAPRPSFSAGLAPPRRTAAWGGPYAARPPRGLQAGGQLPTAARPTAGNGGGSPPRLPRFALAPAR